MSPTPDAEPVDPVDVPVDPVPAAPAAPDAPSPAPDVDTESTTEGSPDVDSEGTETPDTDTDVVDEAAEKAKLEKAMDLIMKVAKEGESSSIGVESIAEAALFIRNSKLTRLFWAAWNLAPAGLQRDLAMAEQSAVGEFTMRYLTPLNPRAYFVPGLLLAGLAKAGVLKFKLNAEEETAMKASLGETPDEASRVAYEAGANEKVIEGIVMPGEGVTKIVTGPLGKIVATVQPELAPAVGVAKVGEFVEGARDSYFKQVRDRVHAVEVAAAQKKAAKEAAEAKAKETVPGTVVVEHNAVATDLEPEVHIPPLPALPANNSEHFSEVKAA